MIRAHHLAIVPLALGLAGCLSHPLPPPAPFHAYGKDSAWDLIIDDRNITFIAAGQQPVVQAKPPAIIGIAGEIYKTPRINVNTVHGTCTASGRTYRDSVQVTVDGKAYEGCGGEAGGAVAEGVPGGALEGRAWRVVEINGRPTPAAGDYSLSFRSDGRLGAKFGCNSIGGSFVRTGAVVTAGEMMATRMACADPAGSFEADGLKVLDQPMTLSWNGSSAVLSNAIGRIVLAPAS
ncbi:META domain-containing protein [Sphingomonas sabuli]|uniref:META domain-containing protein n=1 Tax=Sphingomonas sabuli TaxID=2764186 RepID=A0A7G9L331_9SPHN|nr:META domain-containing protein [Sphingomonas sabuli]QNM83030.1 META domain-containing protein [Sphingomonas sabuli]